MRRRFSVEYKLKILAEADACVKTAQLGELLRRGNKNGQIHWILDML